MKRIILFLMLIAGITSQAQAQISIADLTNKTGAILDEQLVPVTKLLATGLNTGIYVPTSCKLFSVGIQAFAVTYDQEGAFATLDLPVLPVPAYGYAGVRIPFLGLSGYVRGIYLPVPDMPITFFGAGVGYDKTFLVFLNLKAVASYNMMSIKANLTQDDGTTKTVMDGEVGFNATSLNVYATFAKIPLVKPYAFVGASYNRLGVDAKLDVSVSGSPLPQVNLDYSNPLFTPHVGLGVHLFKVLSVEGNLLPKLSISASVGFAL